MGIPTQVHPGQVIYSESSFTGLIEPLTFHEG